MSVAHASTDPEDVCGGLPMTYLVLYKEQLRQPGETGEGSNVAYLVELKSG